MEEQNVQQLPEEIPAQEQPKPKKKGKVVKRVLYFLLLGIFVGVFIYCAIYITNYMVGSKQQSDAYDDLAGLRDKYLNDATEPQATLPSGITGEQRGGVEAGGILPEYRELHALNNDLVGWINIPGTKVDYPVLQRKDVLNFYLYRDFEGETSRWGSLYVREACDVFAPSDNVVIYGHHMRDGTMFAELLKYQKKSFWEEHQTFTFDSIYERHTYQVIAVFKTSANIGEGFSYHTFNTAASEKEFNDFIKTVKKLDFYDTGITAEYGDMLLTLSTCEYTLDNGRFVVVAKRIS